MRTIPSHITDLWNAGGPFIGDAGAAHGRVTVEPAWQLHATTIVTTPDPTRLPYRWWQRADNSQVEVEVPNIKSIEIDRSLTVDAASCEIVLNNQWHSLNSSAGIPGQLGFPGYFTWAYGNAAAAARWGQAANTWSGILVPNALLRTYQGYGGRSKTIAQAITDGNIVLTGVFLIDDVNVGTDGLLHLKCRDMGKLLIDQQFYPPLMPAPAWYPPYFRRFSYTAATSPAVPVYDSTDPIESGPGAEGPKYITDIALSADSKGYWLVGTDGGVFSFGVPFYGSRGASTDDGPMMSIAADPLNHGYWIVTNHGSVFTFGEVGYHGGNPAGVSNIVRIRAHPDGQGYWLLSSTGHVYAFGSAVHHGDTPSGFITSIVDMGITESGAGYWLLSYGGQVYSYGDAAYYGNGSLGIDPYVGIAPMPHSNGYWLAKQSGIVEAIGGAQIWDAGGDFPPLDTPPGTLNDPIFSIAAMPTANGYILVGGDGGVFTFGDAPFEGALPGDFDYLIPADGNITDYSDIVETLLLWGGFLLYDGSTDDVYGLVEPTGAYPVTDLAPDLFDKMPIIDPITKIKEALGFIFHVDEEGGARFTSPNWFVEGNVIEDGSRVTTLPVIDDRFQITDYQVTYSGKDVRSTLVISSSDPTAGIDGTVTTTVDLVTDARVSPLIRNMVLPAVWVNGMISRKDEQERMAERVVDHIVWSFRQGQVTCPGNPQIQMNDQVRIYERITADTFIHYVRGIRSTMDLESGKWMMQLTTNWLGEF